MSTLAVRTPWGWFEMNEKVITYIRFGDIVRHFTMDEDARLVKLRADGRSFTAIARAMHRSTGVVYQRLVALGVHTTKKVRRFTDDEKAHIRELRAQGLSNYRIAPMVGRSQGTVWGVA